MVSAAKLDSNTYSILLGMVWLISVEISKSLLMFANAFEGEFLECDF